MSTTHKLRGSARRVSLTPNIHVVAPATEYGRNRLELYFLESALPENSDWISCSGCENSRSSGKKPNFDPKPQKTRNDSSYQ
jgi:hypothetical protein